ncbi:helix-turn-helix domain-containing protein [uncultured Tateyamaria sp.]|uniref:helix-turn-helix domain-containing protein n=1 Tax=uncultured Tateyamaria sp. TaxID=455651 RepID=UPI00260D584D|nr:helix-turn-helix domain-containing protein [uncultured Tateyamaria sp.]
MPGISPLIAVSRKLNRMNSGFPFEFEVLEPTGALGSAVASLWFARGTVPYEQEHIAPTGSVVAIFVLGDAIEQASIADARAKTISKFGLLIGPHDGPLINRPHGETFAVGIVAKPTSANRLFGISPAKFRGRVADLAHSWSKSIDIRQELSRLKPGKDMLLWLEQHLAGALKPETRSEMACAAAIDLLEADPKLQIAGVADRVAMSVSNLDRTFARVVGITPRSLANLLKMRRLLAELDVRAVIDWAGLAAEYGWYDQSHFVKAFRHHTGHTPTGYVLAQRRHFDDQTLENAAGFVPEL